MATNVTIVAAPLGVMDASGAGSVQSFNYTNSTHTGITHVFGATAPTSSPLWSAFTFSDVSTEGQNSATGGFAAVDVSFNVTQFKAALQTILQSAIGGYNGNVNTTITTSRSAPMATVFVPSSYRTLSAAPDNIKNIVQKEIVKEIEDELNNNGVLEFFEGDSITGFDLVVDYSGGAASMANQLAQSANLRNLFFQFPATRTAGTGLTVNSETGSRLPVVTGDSVSFVFKLDSRVTITELSKNPENALAGGPNASNTPSTLDLSVAGISSSGDTIINSSFTAGMKDTIAFSSGYRKVAFTVRVT